MAKFITFEGIEGSGKSTQAKLLHQYFLNKNIPTIITREPGGSNVAEEIRSLLINGAVNKMDGVCETLLNFAARRDHLQKTIKPALAQNKIVICDRFFDSTIAYQGFGQNVDSSVINSIQNAAIGDFVPNITFLIDVDVKVAFARIKSRADNNRYEKMDENFHQKVRQGFLKIAQDNSRRIIIVDGSKNEQEIHQQIISNLL